ncbi:MAG: YifB family Mg chelatase-like AAA ATPase [Corynebacterium glutamicum]|uniref:YifB family Mg chelatase-like AAA ATPase n=1 Tax=Corynebacterium glutamicum TaxID=1718 RepID=UPI00097EEC4A|nr:YifB family Mg chelatase-like AAA ATPase [Corynebacterium glutamicum]MDO5374373.1 YifB family Mg chelatase-like AAA ATPase [Corynebacterium glutamicum]SJM47949.1 MG(2+) CHELATASE FAMILY PROTEIN / ComM-related protein [Corynebacterium glutamicum]
MALGRTISTAQLGVQAKIVRVEANVGPGLPGTYIVGLADTAISESRDRIKTAVQNSGLMWPKTKVIINLSPASMRKQGSQCDLAMTVAVLVAHGSNPKAMFHAQNTLFLGEVALDGTLLPVTGVLPALLAAKEEGIGKIVIPEGNAQEAGLVEDPSVFLAHSIDQVMRWLDGEEALPQPGLFNDENSLKLPDMRDVVGQPEARFAAEVAAAGGHHMLMIGPPGSGKSMIAERIPSLLPELSPQQMIEATAVHSVVGRTFSGPVSRAPFISPHHNVSKAALLGGGSGSPLPGAISLAHHGVLFLDEVSEIPASILDSLRTPLEYGSIRIIRSRHDVTFPAQFQLILAANPCRCGAEQPQECVCSGSARATYLNNLSGPLRDRLDMVVATHSKGAVLRSDDVEASAPIADRVAQARERAAFRWRRSGLGNLVNAHVDPHFLRRNFAATEDAMVYLGAFLAEGAISQRGCDRAIKLGWTLCDLDGEQQPNLDHIARAMELRGTAYSEVAA